MVIHEDKIEEDRERRGDVRTMEDMTKMANSIISIIKWTNDCPGSNQDGKMPILNLKVWMREKVGKQQICFESHRKRMASPYRTLQKEHHRVGSGSLGQESPGRQIWAETSVQEPRLEEIPSYQHRRCSQTTYDL